MNTKSIRKPLFVGVVVAILLLVFGLVNEPRAPANADNVFSLRAPPFVGVARAEADSITSLIEEEAGISAYFQASTSINLADVRDVFRTIETETSDYIIGSVPVANYPESEDVHVYVHRDGWILAYYLAADPVGKIFDWRVYHDTGRTNITTKLENTLAVVASEAGVPFPGGTYYDFRYPNATHLMFIIEWVYGDGMYGQTDSCEVKLPGGFAYYERSWSLGTNDHASYTLDGTEIADWNCTTFCTGQSTFTAAELLPDQFHTISIWAEGWDYGYGGLVLVYRVP
jgi:hypothetical protein